jgi:2,3-dihydroxy-p-cumate/2,3-dihydroxybenzoate 3,4-dioxygenase
MKDAKTARYRKLGYVALNVTDVARSREFYSNQVGLEWNGEGAEGEQFFRCTPDHHSVILYPAKAPGLKRIGFEMESPGELKALRTQLEVADVETFEVEATEERNLRQKGTFRICEPFTGATFEYYSSMRQAPANYTVTLAKIQRLGHVVLKTGDFDRAVEFYTDVLGCRISDVVDGQVTLMRCFPNPYHHGVALGKADAPGLHHVNFMVSEIDDIGKAMVRFKKSDVPIVYGPGRHPASGSVFLYYLDPDGMTVEYSFGMEEFPEENARPHRVLEPIPQSSDLWGNTRDPRMASVGIIETLSKRKSAA